VKLTELSDIATALSASDDPNEIIKLGKALAQGVSDVLGVGFPCGWPDVVASVSPMNGSMSVLWRVGGPDDGALIHMDADEARGIAAELLRKADEADAADSARAEESGDE
jgi:hypothetical protein